MNEVGSAAEEAARLFAAMEEWARRKAGHVIDPEQIATGATACQICPICQGIAAARSVRPDAVEHLLDAAASLVAALKTAVSAPPPDGSSPRAGTPVQHIDVSEG